MLKGIYDWDLDNLPLMSRYPFHVELEENLAGCNRICEWLAYELGLERYTGQYVVLLDFYLNYILIAFKHQEHSAATKLKWIK